MEEITLKKQKINYEGKTIEGFNDFTVKGEYLIPDTHPDIHKVLMVDVNTNITNSEAFTDKIFVEGEVVYSVIYSGENESGNNTYGVSYSDKFNLYIESFGMKKENLYDVVVEVLDVKASILNERKISIEGLLKFRSTSNESLELDVMNEFDGEEDIELLMKDLKMCEVKGNFTEELINESVINVPMDKVAISKILICDSSIYKTECKILNDKVVYNSYCRVKVLYKGINSDEVCYIEQDIYLTKEVDTPDTLEGMVGIDSWSIEGFEFLVDEDEAGESRVINVYINLKCNLKVLSDSTISVIDDAYSKDCFVNLVKNTYKMNNLEDHVITDIIVKDNFDIENVATNIVYTNGRCYITDKKVVEGKVVVEGVVKSDVIYKTNSSEDSFMSSSYEIPFTTSFDSDKIKLGMDATVRCNLESIDAFIEAKTIGIKAIVNVKVYVNSEVRRDVLVDMYKTQEENSVKDCSCIIYVVGEEDTLWSIAKKYCVSIEDICRVNDISDDEDLSGVRLLIPCKAIF